MSPRSALAPIIVLLLAWPVSAQSPRDPPPVPVAAPNPDRLAPARNEPLEPRSWSLADLKRGELGVGFFSVGGHFVRDRQRQGREPLIEPGGKESRIAAVGLSLRF